MLTNPLVLVKFTSILLRDYLGGMAMDDNDRIFVGGGGADYSTAQSLFLKYANRHGMIAGATGTGKTVTLQILAESFRLLEGQKPLPSHIFSSLGRWSADLHFHLCRLRR